MFLQHAKATDKIHNITTRVTNFSWRQINVHVVTNMHLQQSQSIRQSVYTPFTLERTCSLICSQAGECSAEGTARLIPSTVCPSAFHTNPIEPSYLTCVAGVQGTSLSTRVVTSMQVNLLDSTWTSPLQIS
jgi:hypothetical protein